MPDAVLRLALPLPLPQLFDYLPPAGTRADTAMVGCRARVPFGPRSLVGVVVEVGPPERDGAPLRAAEAVLDAEPLLHGELLASLRWLARYTHAPLGEALSTALPATLRRGEALPDTQAWAWRLTEAGRTALPRLRGRPRLFADTLARAGGRPGDALDTGAHTADVHRGDAGPGGEAALGEPAIDEAALDAALDDWRPAARSLRDRGLAERVASTGGSGGAAIARPGPTLNPEQAHALAALRALASGRLQPHAVVDGEVVDWDTHVSGDVDGDTHVSGDREDEEDDRGEDDRDTQEDDRDTHVSARELSAERDLKTQDGDTHGHGEDEDDKDKDTHRHRQTSRDTHGPTAVASAHPAAVGLDTWIGDTHRIRIGDTHRLDGPRNGIDPTGNATHDTVGDATVGDTHTVGHTIGHTHQTIGQTIGDTRNPHGLTGTDSTGTGTPTDTGTPPAPLHHGARPPTAGAPDFRTPTSDFRTPTDNDFRTPTVFAPALLEGITGSGKTEVYLHAIADCLARGRQALVLVPEIGLTPQTLARFRSRLGVPVHALHSGLADGERARVWAAAARGEARVVVGTRSAVFVPLPEAGLIVIDEEHDGSYKQQDGIRYHARDFALVRAKTLGVPILLGSATPALETLHNARAGRYAHLRLRARAGDARPPAVRVLDVRKRPLVAGLSPELLDGLQRCLDAGGQALVFRNRRGYAPVLHCHDCGWSAHCRRCGTPERPSPLTVHGGGRRLQCHHCGARQTPPPACPDCAGLALQPQGAGTERIEEALAERFPDVPVLRIDSASTRRKDGLQQQLARLGDAPGILVGTQMLAKGHDLPGLTLVAVVGVDEGLFSADFRAGEKLAQLLIQVSGRAGRAARAGTVLLQTHHPEHPLLQTLIHGGYRAFADGELALREAAGFPPYSHLALLRAEAQHADAPTAFLHAAKSLLRSHLPHTARDSAQPGLAPPVDLLGPLPAPMPRRAGVHRAQLLLMAPQRRALHAVLDAALPALYALPDARKVRWSLDVDPADLY